MAILLIGAIQPTWYLIMTVAVRGVFEVQQTKQIQKLKIPELLLIQHLLSIVRPHPLKTRKQIPKVANHPFQRVSLVPMSANGMPRGILLIITELPSKTCLICL